MRYSCETRVTPYSCHGQTALNYNALHCNQHNKTAANVRLALPRINTLLTLRTRKCNHPACRQLVADAFARGLLDSWTLVLESRDCQHEDVCGSRAFSTRPCAVRRLSVLFVVLWVVPILRAPSGVASGHAFMYGFAHSMIKSRSLLRKDAK